MDNDIKEAVIKILEILSTVAPPDDAVNIQRGTVQCQYIIV